VKYCSIVRRFALSVVLGAGLLLFDPPAVRADECSGGQHAACAQQAWEFCVNMCWIVGGGQTCTGFIPECTQENGCMITNYWCK
jgi:hypothetical protein